MKLAPPTALVVRNGTAVRVGTDEVVAGDIVVVKNEELASIEPY